AQAYYGAQTQRAVENFPISGWPLPPPLIRALGLVKLACATANRDLGKLTKTGKNKLTDQQVEKLLAACREVAEGKFDDQFPIDVFQTGSGTSSNMNANEVIANRAIEMLGGDRFQKDKPVHPNDHVNMGQSTNDIFPTAIHVAVALEIHRELIPALERLQKVLTGKVNPVMCESMMQVAARVLGNDQTLAFSGATGGQFQLNIMMPVMGHAALESVHLLAAATRAFIDFCAIEMEANPEACEASVE